MGVRGYVGSRISGAVLMAVCLLALSATCWSDPMGISLTPGTQTVCACEVATLYVDACDSDPYSGFMVRDDVSITPPSGWDCTPVAVSGDFCYHQTCTRKFDNAGVYTFTASATDANKYGYEDDPDVSATATVTVVDNWSPGEPISWDGIATPDSGEVVCVGTEVTCTAATATDDDTKNCQPGTADECTYAWWASGGSFKNDVTNQQTVTWIAPGAGEYTITAQVDDKNDTNKPPGDCHSRDDSARSASVTVKVCGVSLGVGATTLRIGCGWPDPKSLATCTLSDECADEAPTWVVTGPLWVGQTWKQAERVYRAEIHTVEPSGCEQPGTVRADANGCSSAEQTITTKKNGPFTVTPSGGGTTQYYDGTLTFADIGEPAPYPCLASSPVFGCATKFTYSLCVGCPLPGPTLFSEKLNAVPGCMCPDSNEWLNTLPEGYTGCTEVTDTYGWWGCNCLDGVFMTSLDCKTQQSYVAGYCEIYRQCVHVVRSSSTGTCVGLSQSVDVTPGWDGCYCQ